MHGNILKSLVALALVSAPVPILAQGTTDSTEASDAQTAQGAGLWIGVAMISAVVAIILFHDELFDDDEGEPASP